MFSILQTVCVCVSSPMQSGEELAGCHSVMVLLLRDCYTQCYTGTLDSLQTNCHLLCMLTRYCIICSLMLATYSHGLAV